jgi:hypothetical protein
MEERGGRLLNQVSLFAPRASVDDVEAVAPLRDHLQHDLV